MNYLFFIAAICAFFIKGMCGFANTLVFTSILSFTSNNINITPAELLLGYPSNLIIAYRERKAVKKKDCILLSALVLAGNIPGIFLLKTGDVRLIKVVFGIAVVCIGIEMFVREYQVKKAKPNPAVLFIIGILSGVLCGLFGIGALMAAYVTRTTDNTNAFRGTMCIVFVVENTFRIIMYSLTGIITRSVIGQALILMPFMFGGLLLGIFASTRVKEKLMKKIVMILLIISGISLIAANLS